MQKLNMVDADTLLYQPLDKPRFVVDGLIPTGLILFCGSQKIGKSWLMLKLCLCVSAGLPFWEMETRAGDVLYRSSVLQEHKWRYSDLPIVPEEWLFDIPKDKRKQFKVLCSLMCDKRVTDVSG